VTIGVAVEGPSDRDFWDKVLHKHFRQARFDVHNMKNRGALIREVPRLVETFRDLRYAAGFIFVDRDADPCPGAVLRLLPAAIQMQARQPVNERFLFFLVAVRGLESWFLADDQAITALLPRATYSAPPETSELDPKEMIQRLWRQQHGRAAFNKIDFGKKMAPRFNPSRAVSHSASFAYSWGRITSRCRR
jgi:hypothetical protein